MSYITRQPTNPPSSSIPNLPSSSTFPSASTHLYPSSSNPNPTSQQQQQPPKDGMTTATATSPPLPSLGASIKRYHTVSGGGGTAAAAAAASGKLGDCGVASPAGGGVGMVAPKTERRVNKLQSDWRRRDEKSSTTRSSYATIHQRGKAGEGGSDDIIENIDESAVAESGSGYGGYGGYRGGYSGGGGGGRPEIPGKEVYDDIGGGAGASGGVEDSDRTLSRGQSGLFRQTSLPSGGIAMSGFATSHFQHPPSSLSRQSSGRSTRGLSFSPTGGPPSSGGQAREVAAAAAAAAGATVAGAGVGRSSSLRNPMLTSSDWRLTSEDTLEARHQRSYSTSSPFLKSGMLSAARSGDTEANQVASGSLGRASSIKSVNSATGVVAGHSHTRSLYHLGRESPTIIAMPSTSTTTAPPSAGPMSAVSGMSGGSAGSGITIEEDEEMTPGGSVKRTHSLQQGYGHHSKIQERLARSPALFPTYQRTSAAAPAPSSSLGQINFRREDEPPTSPIRRSPWDAASITPENDGWAGVRTRDDLSAEFQGMHIHNDTSRPHTEMQSMQSLAMGPPSSHQALYNMVMQDRYLPKMMSPPAPQMLPVIPQSRSNSQQPEREARSDTPNDGQQQAMMGYHAPTYQPSAGNYIDLGDGGNMGSGRYLSSQHSQLPQAQQQHQLPVDGRWQGNYQTYHQDLNLGAMLRPGGMAVSTGFDPRTQTVYQGGFLPQQFSYHQQFTAAPIPVATPETTVKVPDEVAKKAAQEVERMVASKNLNPTDFDCEPVNARYFVIKSFTEDDVHKSLKHDIWASTTFGNQRLDKAFQEAQGPVYLFYSVNGSGHFCGVAQMTTPVDYNKTSTVWAQDKWKGIFSVKWIYVRDIPNSVLRHIRLLNTQEQKPITNSRDTQELLPEAGVAMLKMFSMYREKTSLLEDFGYYEMQATKKAQMDSLIKETPSDPPQQGGRPPAQGGSLGSGGMLKGFSPTGPPSLAPSRFAVIGGSMNGRGGLRGGPAR